MAKYEEVNAKLTKFALEVDEADSAYVWLKITFARYGKEPALNYSAKLTWEAVEYQMARIRECMGESNIEGILKSCRVFFGENSCEVFGFGAGDVIFWKQ